MKQFVVFLLLVAATVLRAGEMLRLQDSVDAMGTTITGVQRAETGSSYSPVYFQNYALDGTSAKSAAATPIQSGDVTVSATVTITYTIS